MSLQWPRAERHGQSRLSPFQYNNSPNWLPWCVVLFFHRVP